MKKMFKSNVLIKFIGLRHGEKLHETLISSNEILRANSKNKFFEIPPNTRDLNYDSFFIKGKKVLNRNSYTSNHNKPLNVDKVIKVLKKLL